MEFTRSTQPPKLNRRKYRLRYLLTGLAILLLNGCAAQKVLRFTDQEAYCLAEQKMGAANVPEELPTILPSPQSRLSVEGNFDAPAMPEDDPTANQLMRRVDGKNGSPFWQQSGSNEQIETNAWEAELPKDEYGYRLQFQDALRLAHLNNRGLQLEKERVFLQALQVSLERFEFDLQGFGAYQGAYEAAGRVAGGGNSRSQFDLTTGQRGIRGEKLAASGANYVLGLANTLTWNVAGNNDYDASTLVDFTLVQPLLRGAGRHVIMESLTQSERTLLGNVRQYAQYQQAFYLNVLAGRSPSISVSPGTISISNPAGASIGQNGYVGLLLLEAENLAARSNFLSQLDAYDRIQELVDAGTVEPNSRTLVLNSVLRQRSSLNQLMERIGNAKNLYVKDVLSLPASIDFRIEDELLDDVILIEPELIRVQRDLLQLRRKMGAVNGELLDLRFMYVDPSNVPGALPIRDDREVGNVYGLEWSEGIHERLIELGKLVDEYQELCSDLQTLTKDKIEVQLQKMEAAVPDRIRFEETVQVLSDRFRDEYALNMPIDSDIATELSNEVEDVRKSIQEIQRELDECQLDCEAAKKSIDSLVAQGETLSEIELAVAVKRDATEKIAGIYRVLNQNFLKASITNVKSKVGSPSLEAAPFDVSVAVEVAKRYRYDWMNTRMALVDRWRQIEIRRNAMQSRLNLVFSGGVGNVGDNPFRLSTLNGNLRAGLQFDTPFILKQESVDFRRATVEYFDNVQAYRSFGDNIENNLIGLERRLSLGAIGFELARRNVVAAATQVDQEMDKLYTPPQPGANATISANSDILTRAFNNLQTQQVEFARQWLEFELNRRLLSYELGIIELDERGDWVDPGPLDSERMKALVEIGPENEAELRDFEEIVPSNPKPQTDPGVEELPELEFDPPQGAARDGRNEVRRVVREEVKNDTPLQLTLEAPAQANDKTQHDKLRQNSSPNEPRTTNEAGEEKSKTGVSQVTYVQRATANQENSGVVKRTAVETSTIANEVRGNREVSPRVVGSAKPTEAKELGNPKGNPSSQPADANGTQSITGKKKKIELGASEAVQTDSTGKSGNTQENQRSRLSTGVFRLETKSSVD